MTHAGWYAIKQKKTKNKSNLIDSYNICQYFSKNLKNIFKFLSDEDHFRENIIIDKNSTNLVFTVYFFCIHIYIYIYIYELPWPENLAKTYMWHTQHWTTVLTLLGLISRAHCDLHHWRSNQQPQYAEAETLPLGHRFMPHISDAELTSRGELRNHLT